MSWEFLRHVGPIYRALCKKRIIQGGISDVGGYVVLAMSCSFDDGVSYESS